MYRIIWSKKWSGKPVRGLSRYPSIQKAQKQMSIFSKFFPMNDYRIEISS